MENYTPTQKEADEWAERNGLSLHGEELIVAIEDARSMHLIISEDTSKEQV